MPRLRLCVKKDARITRIYSKQSIYLKNPLNPRLICSSSETHMVMGSRRRCLGTPAPSSVAFNENCSGVNDPGKKYYFFVKKMSALDFSHKESSSLKADLCEMCTAVIAKYRCPGCNRVTCSLACTREHKTRWSCSGREDMLAFLKQAYKEDPSITPLDYEEGEEAPEPKKPRKQVHQAVLEQDAVFLNRLNSRLTQRNTDSSDATPKRQSLTRDQAALMGIVKRHYTKGTLMHFLPRSFERSKVNRSRAAANGIILWTIDVNGHVLHSLPDSTRLCDLPKSNFAFANDAIAIEVLEERPGGVVPPRWIPCHRNSTLREALSARHFIEFPRFRTTTTTNKSDPK